MFASLMSQCMIPLLCTLSRVSACGSNKYATIEYAPSRKPTYHGDRDRKRVFGAQGTIFLEVSVQIYPTLFHAQVTGAIVSTRGMQFWDTPCPFDGAVNFTFFSITSKLLNLMRV